MLNMLYRVLAAYKTRVHDPELRATTRVWLWLIVARAFVSFQHALKLVEELLLFPVILLAILVGTQFYESSLRGSRLAFAGICLIALAFPATAWALFARIAGAAAPSGTLFLMFAVLFFGGIISGCTLLAIALFRGTNAEH